MKGLTSKETVVPHRREREHEMMRTKLSPWGDYFSSVSPSSFVLTKGLKIKKIIIVIKIEILDF